MSWGLSVPDSSGGLLIDQHFVGYYLGGEGVQHFPAQHLTGMPHLSYWEFPRASSGIKSGDLIFARPAGPTIVATGVSAAYMGMIAVRESAGIMGVLGPSYVYHYKSLAEHPVGVSGWGVAVYTASGAQAFNSSAHQKRLVIHSYGTASLSGNSGNRWSFSPADSIANYYVLAHTASSSMVLDGTPQGVGIDSRGWLYMYDYISNTISVSGDPGGEYMYCVAKVAG